MYESGYSRNLSVIDSFADELPFSSAGLFDQRAVYQQKDGLFKEQIHLYLFVCIHTKILDGHKFK